MFTPGLVIEKQVVNVTKFLDDHPGGPEFLLELAGKGAWGRALARKRARDLACLPSGITNRNSFEITDATIDFKDIGHSSGAIKEMKSMVIGILEWSLQVIGHLMPSIVFGNNFNGNDR